MYKIPTNGLIVQSNKGDASGNLFRSLNLDLKTNPGNIRISPRLTLNTKDNDTDISGMGLPLAFCLHDISSTKQFYVPCGLTTGFNNGTGKILVSTTNSLSSAFTNDATANSPTSIHQDFSDSIPVSDGVLVSTYTGSTSQIQKLTTSWDNVWFTTTKSGSFTVAGGCKNMCDAFNGNIYITDDDLIIYVPQSGNAVLTGTGTLDFNGKYRSIWIRSSSNRIWISLMTFDGNVSTKGFIAEWDTTGTSPNKIYDIDATCALSGCVLNDVPYIIDAYGRLKAYNGSGFKEVARLPVANMNIEMPGIYNDLTNARWIHQRGMEVVDGKIRINVNNYVSSGVFVEDMPSGIWEYDPETGSLYHVNSPCATTDDFGQQFISKAGAIAGFKRSNSTYLAGYGYYTDATTERYGIFHDDTSVTANRRGSITTPMIMSTNSEDVFQKIYIRLDPLVSGEKIKFKYRKYKTDATVITVTWTSTTGFNTTSDLSTYSIGDEVEITQGKGASATANISALQASDSGYIVTLDEAIGFTSGTSKAVVRNFKPTGNFIETGIMDKEQLLAQTSTKIQVKADIVGNVEIDDLSIISSKFKQL